MSWLDADSTITATDRRMIELDEAGWRVCDIADELGLDQDFVLLRLQNLPMNDPEEDRRFFTKSRVATMRLAKRILRHHPERAI